MVNADFERCTDFLARMIEKYGGELDLPKTEENDMNDTIKQVLGLVLYLALIGYLLKDSMKAHKVR